MVRTGQSPLPAVWRRAAALGGLWAAVEIVVGSFLHNVRFPLTGAVLAGVGVCLLVAGNRFWPERGLIWRAGLVCALMKSISPSAVILGPMIGILSEALLVEGAVRLLGRNAAGFLAGGALAALEPLLHRVVNYLVTYGADAARLYVALCDYAARALRLPALGPAEVLIAFGALSVGGGLTAAALGLAVARAARAASAGAAAGEADAGEVGAGEAGPGEADASEAGASEAGSGAAPPSGGGARPAAALPLADPWAPAPGQRFSPPLLIVHLAALVAGLALLGRLPWPAALLAAAAYAALALLRYPSVRRRLARPRFWAEVAVVSLLAGLLLGGLGVGGLSGRDGLLVGLRMALRAVLVVTAFAAIGLELRHPRLVGWFLRRGLGGLSAALGLAFAALPFVMARLGDHRRLRRRPVRVLGGLLADLDDWLDARAPAMVAVHVVTGPPGAGKTSLVSAVAERLRRDGWQVGGIVAPAVGRGGAGAGYDVVDLRSGAREPLCRESAREGAARTGRFAFAAAGLAHGQAALAAARERPCDLVCVDEVGPLELRGQGWAEELAALAAAPSGRLLLVIRPQLVEGVLARWNLRPAAVWMAGEADAETVAAGLREGLPPDARPGRMSPAGAGERAGAEGR